MVSSPTDGGDLCTSGVLLDFDTGETTRVVPLNFFKSACYISRTRDMTAKLVNSFGTGSVLEIFEFVDLNLAAPTQRQRQLAEPTASTNWQNQLAEPTGRTNCCQVRVGADTQRQRAEADERASSAANYARCVLLTRCCQHQQKPRRTLSARKKKKQNYAQHPLAAPIVFEREKKLFLFVRPAQE